MRGRYAISLFDCESISFMKLILGKAPKVYKVFILYMVDRNIEKELIELTSQFGVEIEYVPIYDINNFFEVYLILERICEINGFPSWVNIASGSGMALSALTLHAYFKDAPLVIFDRGKDTIIITHVNKLKKIKIYKNRYFELISFIQKKNQTNLELARHFNLSVSSMSRRLKHLEMLDIVTKKGLGRVNFPYVYQLTEFGKRLILLPSLPTPIG